jgi:hypothetical protein
MTAVTERGRGNASAAVHGLSSRLSGLPSRRLETRTPTVVAR